MIGDRKILLKIVNENILVRVGGGYMSIDEFIECNPDLVLDKFEMMARLGNQGKQSNASEGIQKVPKSTPLKR